MTDRGWGRVFGVALIYTLMVGAVPAWAGQGADAMIFGQVTDASGAVLPGATVTVTSPALQVPQMVAVTDERGEYRVTPLPLGTYSVEYTLQGFQTQRRDGIRLTAGFTARLDVALGVGGVAETVTVSGASPVVDVKTTSAGTLMQREMLEAIPTARHAFTSVLALAAGARPNVDLGGTRFTTDTVFEAFGRRGEAWATVDGLPISPPDSDGNTGFQTAFNYSALQEASVNTLGTNAEAPTSGVQLNVITKSGSNQFHGTGFTAGTWDWLETKSNLNDRLIAQGLRAGAGFSERWEVAGDVGGRIMRDRLWFWVGGRDRQEAEAVIGTFYPDGKPSEIANDQRFYSGKVTAQLSQGQQLIGSIHLRDNLIWRGPANRFADVDQLQLMDFRTWPQAQGTWQLVRGNRVLSVQGGVHSVNQPWTVMYTDNAGWRDDVTGFQGGQTRFAGWRFLMDRYTAQATLNWYKPDLKGNHDFKVGSMYTQAQRNNPLKDRGQPPGNYTLRYRNGVASEIEVGNHPIDPQSWVGYLGLYAQDSWALNRRLTLNLGVRYANDRAWLPAQCRTAAPREFGVVFPAECWDRKELKTWNPVTPRVHLAYDLTGDAKTVIKGGWGRFYMMHEGPELNVANPNSEKAARFRWRDLNNNRYFDAGESDLRLNGPDFVSISIPGAAYVIEGPGGNTTVPALGLVDNPNLDEQGSDEFSVSLERELIANFALRVTGLYVREFNVQRILNPLRPYAAYNIPVSSPDPGPDNRLGTADDTGKTLTYYDYPASLQGAAFNAAMFINDPNADANYKSFELAVNKRLSNHWQLLASYSATKKHIPVPRNSSFDPNTEILSADDTWDWLSRFSGSYQLPLDVQVSANLLVQSGYAYARSVSATGGRQITSVILWTEPFGTLRSDTLTMMSLGMEKAFHPRQGHRLAVGAQFFNLLNSSSDVQVPQTRGGPQLGYSLGILPPRLGELTLRYSF